MFLANDELYYISKHKDGSTRRKAKVVVGSKEQAKVVFRQLHLEKPSPHQGVNRSLQQISKKYFWPKMTYDIMKWVKTKKICSMLKRMYRIYSSIMYKILYQKHLHKVKGVHC